MTNNRIAEFIVAPAEVDPVEGAGLPQEQDVVNPDLPLKRGFARVMAGDRLVKTVDEARAAGTVSLHFDDGAVAATVEGGPSSPALEKAPSQAISPTSRPSRKSQEGGEIRQQDLFS